MATQFKIKRGLKANLPSSAQEGEPLFCTDTGEFFIGKGEGNPLSKVSPDVTKEYVDNEFLDRGINVKWFGAKGDGVTDDTVAIQNAINSLTTGGKVELLNGTHIINETLNIPNNVQLIGKGHSTIIKANAPMTNVISLTGSSSFGNRGAVVKDFKIDCNNQAQTGLYVGSSTTGTVVLRSFKNIKVGNALGYGLILDGCQNNLFELMQLDNNAGHIKLLNGAGNNTFLICSLNAGTLPQIISTQDNTLPSWTLNLFSRIPQGNLFIGCIIERAIAPNCVKLEYAKTTVFERCEFESGGTTNSAISIDSNSTYTWLNTCRFAGTGATVPSIINNSYQLFINDSYFENYPTEIQTGNRIHLSNNWSNVGKVRVTNTGGNIADNIKFNDAPTYLAVTDIASVTTYPGEILYDDSDNLYFKNKTKNLKIISGEYVSGSITTASGTSHQTTLNLTGQGSWQLDVYVGNGDNNHKRVATFFVRYHDGTVNDLIDAQKIGNDSVIGSVVTAVSATVDVAGLVTINATTSGATTANIKYRAVKSLTY